jgi:hypothetical protein
MSNIHIYTYMDTFYLLQLLELYAEFNAYSQISQESGYETRTSSCSHVGTTQPTASHLNIAAEWVTLLSCIQAAPG